MIKDKMPCKGNVVGYKEHERVKKELAHYKRKWEELMQLYNKLMEEKT